MPQHHAAMLAVNLVERIPDQVGSLKSSPPVKATLGPMRNLGLSRRDLFEKIERDALIALPTAP